MMSSRVKRILSVFVIIIVFGITVKNCFDPEQRAKSFVKKHGDELAEIYESNESYPKRIDGYEEISPWNINEWNGEHPILEIRISAWFSTYSGCYYSPDGVPVPFQNADMPLVQDGHEYWEWSYGDSEGFTSRIDDYWFYFEATIP